MMCKVAIREPVQRLVLGMISSVVETLIIKVCCSKFRFQVKVGRLFAKIVTELYD